MNNYNPGDYPGDDVYLPVDPDFAMKPYLGEHMPKFRSGNDKDPTPHGDYHAEAAMSREKISAEILSVQMSMVAEIVNNPANGYKRKLANFVRHAILSLLKSYAVRDGNWRHSVYLLNHDSQAKAAYMKWVIENDWGMAGQTAERMDHYRLNHMPDSIYEEFQGIRDIYQTMPPGEQRQHYASRLTMDDRINTAITYYFVCYSDSHDEVEASKAYEMDKWWKEVTMSAAHDKERRARLRALVPPDQTIRTM